jgi:nitrate/nitrite transport system permease protein
MTVSDSSTSAPYYGGQKESLFFTEGVRAFLLFVGSLLAFLLFWEIGARADWFTKGMPTASETLKELWWWVTNPFFNNGPNDLGIGWNLLISLRRVAIGYFLASLVAVPLGILMGISTVAVKGSTPMCSC